MPKLLMSWFVCGMDSYNPEYPAAYTVEKLLLFGGKARLCAMDSRLRVEIVSAATLGVANQPTPHFDSSRGENDGSRHQSVT